MTWVYYIKHTICEYYLFLHIFFQNLGSNVFATGRDREKLNKLSEEIPGINCYTCDLHDESSIANLNNKVHSDSLGIDILVNSAGFFSTLSLADISKEDYDRFFNINVRAPILLSSFHAENMKRKMWGRIFNIGSSSCYNGGKNTSLYCSSKHALLGFSKSISEELKRFNVRVTNLSPSSTKTEMGKIPLDSYQDYNTFIDPEEVADVLAFLCSFDGAMEVKEILLNRVHVQ